MTLAVETKKTMIMMLMKSLCHQPTQSVMNQTVTILRKGINAATTYRAILMLPIKYHLISKVIEQTKATGTTQIIKPLLSPEEVQEIF